MSIRRRYNFALLKFAAWWRVTKELFGAHTLSARFEYNMDIINSEGQWPQYPGAVSMTIVVNGRKHASS